MVSHPWRRSCAEAPCLRRGLLLLLVCAVLVGLAGCRWVPERLQARHGVLDLRNADLDHELWALDGEWAHFPERWVPPESVDVAAAPGWSRPIFKGQGYGTFALRLRLPPAARGRWALASKELNSAAKIWVADSLVHQSGVLGKSLAEEGPRRATLRAHFTLADTTVILVYQYSNYHAPRSGALHALQLGSGPALTSYLDFWLMLQALLIGLFLLFGIQYLVIWGLRRSDRAALYFALYSLCWAAYSAFQGLQATPAALFFPDIGGILQNKAWFTALVISIPLTCYFWQSVFPTRLLARSNPWLAGVSALYVAGIWVLGGNFYWQGLNAYLVVSDLFLLLLFYSVAVAWRQRVPGAGLFLGGLLVFSAIAVYSSVASIGDRMAWGALLLVLLEALMLARRHAHTYRTVEAQNAELERMAKLKDDFLAHTSHELRTPLQGIIGIAESIRPGQDPAEQHKNLDFIVASSLRLSRLVDEILDFSKLRHGESRLHVQAVSLPKLLEQVVPGFAFWQQRSGVELRVVCPADTPCIAADPERLVQTLYNLIGNAFKFTKQGSITLRVHAQGDAVTIAVEDTGPGMDTAELQNIFEPFAQGLAGLRSREGTGLGLAICKKLTELQKGQLWATAEPGQGSTFFLRYPIAHEIAAANTSPAQVPIPEESPSDEPMLSVENAAAPDAPCVLAIDDEPMNLRVLVNHLSGRYRIHTALSGADALERIAAVQPDLVLLDVMMPEKDGYAVCRDIRAQYDPLALPVLFITAKTQPEDLLSGFACGGNDYIMKPFLRQELEARIEAQLQARRVHRMLQEVATLKDDLGGLVKEKFELAVAQRRLRALLHQVRVPLAVTDESATVVFANQGFADLAGFSPDTIPGLPWSRFVAEDDNRLLHRLRGPALVCEIHAEALELGEERMTVYFVRHGKDPGEWPPWSSRPQHANAAPSAESLHDTACAAMNLCIQIWCDATGLDKVAFAEKSGLWKVHRDENGWGRTITLDKYLERGKFPKFPKWNKVLDSLDFVLIAARHVGHTGSQLALLAEKRALLADTRGLNH